MPLTDWGLRWNNYHHPIHIREYPIISYMNIGFHIRIHNDIRDIIYRVAQEIRFRPQHEVPGLSPRHCHQML